MKKNPRVMTRDELVKEVYEHRTRWLALEIANEKRLEARRAAETTSKLPPLNKVPVVMARPEHLAAVAEAKAQDEQFLFMLTALTHHAIATPVAIDQKEKNS